MLYSNEEYALGFEVADLFEIGNQAWPGRTPVQPLLG